MLDVFEQFELASRQAGTIFPLVPRLILSVDRSGGAEAALSTVALAIRLRAEGGVGRYVVGIDFSGNPTVSGFAQFAAAFTAARCAGLHTVVHAAEIFNDPDTDAILAFRPDRLGHALHLSAAHVAALEAAPIPIELCPTSNMKTLRLRSLADHPTLRRWIDGGYPVSISTDDFGVFATSASRQSSTRRPGSDRAGHQRLEAPSRLHTAALWTPKSRVWVAWAPQCSPRASPRRRPKRRSRCL